MENSLESYGKKMPIGIHDLLDPLHGKSGFDRLRKSVQKMEKKPMTLHPPLPKVERERLERKVAYDHSKKDITKWESLVKRNREAPTIYFKKDVDLGFSTVGSIASAFEPRTQFEKEMATLINDPKMVEAHEEDGKKLLELNEVSMEDVKDRQNRLAKMRSLLFYHDIKQKRIRKIKSKAYHRMMKKDLSKTAGSDGLLMDPEVAKEEARKREFKRAEERLTLKHKNKSKWAQRILKRGLNAQDEGTRAALSEQLHQHEQLTRKMNSIRESSSEDSSSDDECEDLSEEPAKILHKARDKTLQVLKEEDNPAQSGVLSLPFMVRGLKKKRDAAEEEAQHAIRDYDASLGNLDDPVGKERGPTPRASGGRRVFGVPNVPSEKPVEKDKSERYDDDSTDGDTEIVPREKESVPREKVELLQEQWNDQESLAKGPEELQENASKDLDIDRIDLGNKTTYEVSIFASGSWRKMSSEKSGEIDKETVATTDSSLPTQKIQESNLDSDVQSEDEMVEGILSSRDEEEYVLPSQSDLIRRAFACDDVELDFEKDKEEALNEEVPQPEKPLLLPGWGQWTNVQKKKGLPSWIVKEHEDAKRKREDALKNRKDANLKHVIISEKPDKKAVKLHTKSLPFPFTSKEVFEQNLRMPIGPDFNPATSVRALVRPSVVKESGVKIEPIKYEEVDPHQKSDEPTNEGKSKLKKRKRENGRAAATARKATR